MNKWQQKYIREAIEFLLYCNNELDDDVIQDSINDLAKAETYSETMNRMEYAISALGYRNGATGRLRRIKRDITSYESLLNAIQNEDKQAAEWFNKQAESGEQVRIM